jgi:hypothetical protein
MGLDFVALMDRRHPAVDAPWLAEYLRSGPPFAPALIERYAKYWFPTAWTLETSLATSCLQVIGPGGFAINFYEHTLRVYHTMRFDVFTGDPVARRLLREACMTIADLIGADCALYTHELMLSDKKDSVAASSAELRRRIGPPAATFEELHAAESFGERKWYIDDFSDLGTAT